LGLRVRVAHSIYLVGEKNEKSKILISMKMNDYLSRAETLKQHIAQAENSKKSIVGANGVVNGGAGKK
jgi:vacuolar protein-sorting-associated protein 4